MSDVSEGCRTRLLLLTSGYRNAPEPTHNLLYKHRAHTHTHTHTHTETYQQAHTHIPLCCELDSTIGASVGQAYYSSPEGVVSLLTGRHKYSSTSSPRVNGCPSGSNETYRVVWARCRHTQYGHFYWNSKVTYGDGEYPGRTRSHKRQARILCFSMFTWAQINRFIYKIPPTQLKSPYTFPFECTHTDLCAYFSC